MGSATDFDSHLKDLNTDFDSHLKDLKDLEGPLFFRQWKTDLGTNYNQFPTDVKMLGKNSLYKKLVLHQLRTKR